MLEVASRIDRVVVHPGAAMVTRIASATLTASGEVAFVGLSSIGLDRFVEAGARTFGAGPALHLPLFEGGRLRAQLDAKRAEADAAVDAYNGTLLRALREVADEVSSLQSIERQQRAQAEATAAADAAYETSLGFTLHLNLTSPPRPPAASCGL